MKRITLLSLALFIGLFPLLSQKVDMTLFENIKPRNIGPAGMSGRVTSIEVDLSDNDNILLGTAAGGVWQSTNAGHTWKAIFENEKAASIGDVKMYQKNPNIIYVGTGEGNPRNSQNSGYGIYKSIDGGNTWQHLGLENTRQIHRVIIHPDDPNTVWAGVSGATWGDSEDRGVYKTTDGGVTWQKILYINNRTGVSDMRMDPTNPNKIIVGMYEHRRWPWTFKSGGQGSGLYMTLDGGVSWKQITSEDGIADGELGRIGIAIAASSPSVVYAYIESSDNAIYRSDDGGYKWEKVSKSGDSNIGGRPFYYADIYVDTQNENRIYSIASEVTSSEDGGKTWKVFAAGNKLHTDHHAWWGHPDDSDFLMVGHDGGFNITHDRGKNWWFADNLPLGQFYHIRVDNEIPYNLYGGLQDNGSWRGPSQTWFKGGIRNMYWQRLSIGDGFDMIPDPLDNNFGYAMGQAGNLIRYHYPSGQLQPIKPVHPDGEHLRFNWNSGIAIDPHDNKTIYYGSQYLLKSTNYGQSWDLISPDLTTNDPEKARFLETGGLSYDLSGAENHLTIISIAPSLQVEGVIWVGTDDGQVQLTRDGGSSWSNLTKAFKDLPENTWVTQIQPSKHDAAEAFVVFDDHRRNNWEPYIYRTQDYGKSWTRLVDTSDVWGYALSFEQDPIVSNLYFAGTEFGLYVSFDAGETWNKWSNLPTMPIQDMVIQPREHDLAIGTFGRSFWIIDDIRPLREVAESGAPEVLNSSLTAFPAPYAYLANIGESKGYRFGKIGDALFEGDNRPYGSLISYYVQDARKGQSSSLKEQVKLEIKNANGEKVRTLYHKPTKGVNRVNWKLDRDVPRYPHVKAPSKETAPRGANLVSTGTYSVDISYNGQSVSTSVEVKPDPRLSISSGEMAKKYDKISEYYAIVEKATSAMDAVRKAQKKVDQLEGLLNDSENGEPLNSKIEELKSELQSLEQIVVGEKKQGLYRDPYTIQGRLSSTGYLLKNPLVPLSENHIKSLNQTEQAVNEFVTKVKSWTKGAYANFQTEVKEAGISIFD